MCKRTHWQINWSSNSDEWGKAWANTWKCAVRAFNEGPLMQFFKRIGEIFFGVYVLALSSALGVLGRGPGGAVVARIPQPKARM